MADIDNQPQQDLKSKEAIEKLKQLAEKCRNCMFTTHLSAIPGNTRPMSLQGVDEEGVLWYISSSESDKNKEIEIDKRVAITFQNEGSCEYLSIYGHAAIHTDKTIIDKYWTNFANAWFDGKEDPRVTIISVHPAKAYYWDTKYGKFISLLKMSYAAITQSSVDDGGVEGSLKI